MGPDYSQPLAGLSSKIAFRIVNSNIYALFATRFPAERDRPAIELPDGSGLSYRALDARAAGYARFLAGLGLPTGARVLVQVEKSVEALCFYLGCLRAGLVYVPLNTAYRRAEVEYLLGNAEPAIVVCDPGNVETLQAAAAGGIAHRYTLAADGGGSLVAAGRDTGAEFATRAVAPDDTAVILYTSGTTGRPKGAMISHRNLAANGLALARAWGFRADDVLLHALPIFHIHGLFVACHCALLGGARMIFLPKFDAAEIVRRLPQATVFMGVPTYYTRLLARPEFGREPCRHMRLFTCGSAPLLAQTFEEFRARSGHAILERYGMTETGMNTSNPLEGERRPGTVGPPLPGVSVRIVDEHGAARAAGEVGELQVRGEHVFRGYWRAPDKTAESFAADGWFKTGDLARRDADGYVAIVGRAKDLIISGGLNVYPKEVESEIDRIAGVRESAVIGLPHRDFGEAVVAVVVTLPGAALSEQAVLAALRERLANYKLPKRVFLVEQLPRNAMGKVQKNRLRDDYAATFEGNC